MLQIRLPEELSSDFLARIPAHRAYVDLLINKGVMLSYAVNTDRTHGWVIIEASDADEALKIFSESPLFRFVRVRVDELFIYDSESLRLPKMNLN